MANVSFYVPFAFVVLLAFLVSPSQQALTDPPPGVTDVYISVYMNSIAKLDGVEQSFSADFYLTGWWIDNRLDPNVTFDSSANFNPTIEFQNSLGGADAQVSDPFSFSPPAAAILGLSSVPSGIWVKFDQRFIGSFSSPLNLQEFPYDQQDLVLSIESSLWTNDSIQFKKAAGLEHSMLPSGFVVVEWDMDPQNPPYVVEDNHFYENFQQAYSRLSIHVPLARSPVYYVFKIFLGSILLVLMSIAIYALGIDEPDRMMGTITVFLALISFLFVAGGSIPKIAYQTKLDNFMNFSFLNVFFMLISHAVNYIIHSVEEHKAEGREEKPSTGGWFQALSGPRKLDVVFATCFSIIYLIGVPVILLI